MPTPTFVVYSFNHVRMTEFADSAEAHRFLARVNAGYTADLYYLTRETPQYTAIATCVSSSKFVEIFQANTLDCALSMVAGFAAANWTGKDFTVELRADRQS